MSFMIGHQTGEFADVRSYAGAWSPPTSRANFCEQDYTVSFYIAEFINSLTNLAYIYPALRYMYGPGSRGVFAPKVDFMSMSLLMLGIGSFLFHATLRQALEFVDELSMLGLTWSMLQAVLTAQQSTATARLISIALAAFHIPYLAFYVWSAQIIYQVVAFLGAIALIGFRTHYLLYQPGMSKEKSRDWTVRALRAVFISLFGYILWNIDIKFCQELRDIRGQVGLPWAWLFEFHGWWHILTALGAARFMDVVREVHKDTDMRKRA